MQAGIFDIIFAAGSANGGNITDMLHHGSDGNRRHDQNSRQIEFGHLERGQAHNVGLSHAGEVNQAAAQGNHIGDQNAHQNRNDLEHAFSPHVADNDNHNRKGSQPPVFRSVGHGAGCQDHEDDARVRGGSH